MRGAGVARKTHSSPAELATGGSRQGIRRTAAWLASCLISWALFYPFFGPWAALLGLYVPLVVSSPGPSPVAVLKAGKLGKGAVSWSWRRLLRPGALAAPLALAVVCAWLVTVMPSGSRYLWGSVAVLSLAVVFTAWWGGIQVNSIDAPLGQDAAGAEHRWFAHTSGGTSRIAVAAAMAAGGAWSLRTVGRPLSFGTAEVAPGMERAADAVRWLDTQFSTGVFGPTYERQQYWVGLVVGSALLAALFSVLLRNFTARQGVELNPFGSTTSEPRTDAPLPEATGKVFLSYSRKDSAVAREIRKNLEGKLRNVWVDWEAIEPSEKWRQAIDEGIRTSDAFIFLVSEDSLRSPYCRDECMKAIDLRKRILPVVIDPNLATGVTAAMNEHGWAPLRAYQSFHMLEGSTGEDSDRGIQRIVSFVAQRHRWDAFHTRLGNLAHDWWESGCKEGLLLRAEELSLAAKWQEHPWREEHDVSLTEGEARYLAASRRSARRRAIRLRAGLALVTAAVVTLSSLAVSSQRDAEDRRRSELSQKLAATSLGLFRTEPEKAVQLALAAYGQASTVEARNALASQLASLNNVRTVIAPKKGQVGLLFFSPDGKLLFIQRDESVEIWDVTAAHSRGTLPGTLLDWSGGGRRSLTANGRTLALITGQRSDRIELIDTRTLKTKDTISASEARPADSWGEGGISPDGEYLVLEGEDGRSGVLWNVSRHRILKSLSCDRMGMAPSGKTMACEKGDEIQVRDLPDLMVRQNISAPALSFRGHTADDGVVMNEIGAAEEFKRVEIYEPGSSEPWIPGEDLSLNLGFLVEDGRYAVLYSEPTARFETWDLKAHKKLRSAGLQAVAARNIRMDAPVTPQSSGMYGPLQNATADGRRVATVALDGSVVIWGPTVPGRLTQHHALPPDALPPESPWPGGKIPLRIAVSPSTNTFAVAFAVLDTQRQSVQLRDSRTGKLIRTLGLAAPGASLAFNEDGSLLAVALSGYKTPSPVEVFDVSSGRPVAHASWSSSSSSPPELFFSPDSEQLYIIQGGSEVDLWRLSTSSKTRSFSLTPRFGYAASATFSADGKRIAANDEGDGDSYSVRLWDSATGKRLHLNVHNAMHAALSSDGRVLATLGTDQDFFGDTDGGPVTLWDTATAKQIGADLVPKGGVSRLLFSPDGRTLAVLGKESDSKVSLTLWDVASHTRIGTDSLRVQRDAVIGFAPDSSRMDVADESGITRVQVATPAWVAALCGMLTGPLGNSDWQDAAPREHYRSPC
jgi:WD40 repeat protein